MTNTSVSSNVTFDPYAQSFVLLGPDGVTANQIPLDYIVQLQHVASSATLVHGIQIGISAILLLVLVLMTKPEKRRNVVFTLNVSATLLILVRGIIEILVVMGPVYNFYNWALAYHPENSRQRAAVAQAMAAEALSFLITLAIELSMLFQTRTVVKMNNFPYRTLVLISCYLVALLTIAIRFAAMVLNSMWSILDTANLSAKQWTIIAKMGRAFNGSIIGSIIFFSAIFCIKLGQAILKRRALGLKHFGPLQVIFVMGCQTLLIPSIFGVLSYWVLDGAQLYTMMLCIVAAFLPLSSIWASTKTEGNNNIAAPNLWHNRRALSTSARGKNARYNSEKNLLHSNANTATLTGDDHPRSQGASASTPPRTGHHAIASHDSLDLELAKMGHHIHVDRTYSVRSD